MFWALTDGLPAPLSGRTEEEVQRDDLTLEEEGEGFALPTEYL